VGTDVQKDTYLRKYPRFKEAHEVELK